MSLKTYSQLKLFVQDKLDLRDEDFITDTELLSYTEEALKYCEAEIHKLNIEDQYFVSLLPIALVSGRSDYSLPSNIYAHKILRLVYSKDSDIHQIRRMTNLQRFELAEVQQRYGSNTQGSLLYMLVNNDPRVGTKIRFYPNPSETTTQVVGNMTTVSGSAVVAAVSTTGIEAGHFLSGTGIISGTRVLSVDSPTQLTMTETAVASDTVSVTSTDPRLLCWYIRTVSIPTADTDYIDFPEFWYFIAQHVVVNCLKKEIGNPRLQIEVDTLRELKEQMHSTLANMVPDQNDEIEKDMSHYDEMGVSF